MGTGRRTGRRRHLACNDTRRPRPESKHAADFDPARKIGQEREKAHDLMLCERQDWVRRRGNSRPITPWLLISAALILGGVVHAVLYRAGQPEVTTGNV